MDHSRRFYREYEGTRGISFNVKIDTTDLYITAEKDLSGEAYDSLKKTRAELEKHIKEHQDFLYSLTPLTPPGAAPAIVLEMYRAALTAGVGPMAAVAGAVAEHTGRELVKMSNEVIVENGGDIWMKLERQAKTGVYTDNIFFREKIWLKINPEDTPCSICTSTSKLGHSLSFGKADAATVIAENGALADAVATGACNIVQSEEDIQKALDYAMSIEGVTGCMIIYRDKLGAQGMIELCAPG
ncbi:MAG TPA: UPF0280 family protein [Spirochaetota bacterium]|nr:UPF0280 family protein [Spirochaetota bacterium]HPJ36311.1 UPF0280 family protein [Spirochaetota bacterium]